jgi:hypothetical protein
LANVPFDLAIVVYDNGLLLVVNLDGLGLVELDGSILVSQEVANGLHDGSVFDCACGAGGQQGGEEEVVSGGDDNDIVILGIQFLEQRYGAPAGAFGRERSQSSNGNR